MTFAAEFPIRFGDVDYVRVVYYPRFFHLYHRTFENWFENALGVPYSVVITEENIGFPAVSVQSEFLAPLRFGEMVRVELELNEIGKKSITCGYEITRLSDGVTAARATIKTVVVDNDTFQSIPVPEKWRDRFRRFMDEK